MDLAISSVTLSYFVHSTEEVDRLNRAVCEVLGILDDEVSRESLEGHYGNKVEFVKAHLTGKRAEEVVERISEKSLTARWMNMMRYI